MSTGRPAPKITVNDLLAAIQRCRPFISIQQIEVMGDACRGEERDWFRQKFLDLAKLFETMPKTYEQEPLGEEAIVHLHYFHGSGDWYITERDMETAQLQAFGLADPFGDGGELGYISIELIRHGAELDLHWRARPISEVLKERERRAA